MNSAAAILNMFAALMFMVSLTGVSHAATLGYSASVPREADEIRNPRFRDELAAIAPNYDSLSRDAQVQAYVRAYRSLNYGASPYIVSDEFQNAGASSSPTSLPILVPILQPPGYEAPDSGFIQQYIEGYGYKRVPVRSPSSSRSSRSERGYGRGVDTSREIGARYSTGTGAPPYAKPYVAGPQRVPSVRPGW